MPFSFNPECPYCNCKGILRSQDLNNYTCPVCKREFTDSQLSDIRYFTKQISRQRYGFSLNIEGVLDGDKSFWEDILFTVQRLFLDYRGREFIEAEKRKESWRTPSEVRWLCTRFPQNRRMNIIDGDYDEQKCLIQILSCIKISVEEIPHKDYWYFTRTPEIDYYIETKGKLTKAEMINVISDPFGLYYSGRGTSNPRIVIDKNKIQKAYPENVQEMVTIVLVHEIMHALMDPFNYIQYQKRKGLKIEYDNIYGIHKEEAYANALTYIYISAYGGKKLIASARLLMENQPCPYKYGYDIISKQNPDAYSWIKEKVNGTNENTKYLWIAKEKEYWTNQPQAIITTPNFNFITYANVSTIRKVNKKDIGDSCEPFDVFDLDTDNGIIILKKINNRGTPKDIRIKLEPRQFAVYAYIFYHPEGLDVLNMSSAAEKEILKYYQNVVKWRDREILNKSTVSTLKKSSNSSQLVSSINEKIDNVLGKVALLKSGYYHLEKNDQKRYIIPIISY